MNMLLRKSLGRRGGSEVLKRKSCPRCKTGDVGVDRDHHGWYEYCIQCGYVRDLISMVESAQPTYFPEKRPRKAKTSSKGE
jgi:hypothetical protein